MPWKAFPYPSAEFEYGAARLKKAWPALHAGDVEPWPHGAALVDGWIDYHAGRFERATQAGLQAGMAGAALVNKAACMHAVYLADEAERRARLLEVAARSERQQREQPESAAAFYWHAYALGRHSQDISVLKALTQGVAGKVKASLDSALQLAPRHADAHIALGVYHAEVIDKVGALVASLTYGASRDAALRHFGWALELNPDSAIARIEYARALVMLDGRRRAGEALAMCEQAAASIPHDATERLDVERARQELA